MRKIKPEKIEKAEATLDAPREYYPHLGISLEHLPEARDWKIGETYCVTLEVKQTGLEIHESKHGKGGHASFDITGIEVEKKAKSREELPDIT